MTHATRVTGRRFTALVAGTVTTCLVVLPLPGSASADEATDPGWQAVAAAALRSDSLLTTLGGTWESDTSSRGEYRTVVTIPPGAGWLRIQDWDPETLVGDRPPATVWVSLDPEPVVYERLDLRVPTRLFPRLRGVRWFRTDDPAPAAPSMMERVGSPIGPVTRTVTGADTSTVTWTARGYDGTPATATTATAWLGPVPGSQGEPVVLSLRLSPPASTVPGGGTDIDLTYGSPGIQPPRGWDTAVPEDYVDRLLRAWSDTRDTQEAVAATVTAAADRHGGHSPADTRRWLRAHIRDDAWLDGPVRPRSTRIVDVPAGVQVTNANRYTGVRTRWTLEVTPSGRVDVNRQTSRLGLAPMARVP